MEKLKGFQISPCLIDHVPLNIIRCQQLIDQKPVLLQQLFKLRICPQFGRLQTEGLQIYCSTGNLSLAHLHRSCNKTQSKPIFSVCTASNRLAF